MLLTLYQLVGDMQHKGVHIQFFSLQPGPDCKFKSLMGLEYSGCSMFLGFFLGTPVSPLPSGGFEH